MRAGAHGYVTKAIDPADLAVAVRSVAAGEAVFSPSLAGFVLGDPELSSLTPREREVLPEAPALEPAPAQPLGHEHRLVD